MNLNDDHKKEVGLKIADLIDSGIRQKTITEDEASVLSTYIIENLEKINTHEELMNFLRELSAKNAIFSYLLVTESGEVKEQKDNEVAREAEGLVKNGKIDEALSMIKEEIKISDQD